MEITSENNFLGAEKVGKLLRMFAVPCVLSLIIQSLYNLVDQIFIGHCEALGAAGNAATGIVYPLTIIALGIGLWIGDGCAASMSLNQGQGNTKGTAKGVGTALFYGTAASIVLMIICFCLKEPILIAIGAYETEVFEKASEYANFIIGGFLFFTLACVINPIIRADGSPKFAMLAMAIGAIINIGLDPLFIYAFNMGMTGAALATFLGQLITFVLHVAYLFKTKTFKLKARDLIPGLKEIGDSKEAAAEFAAKSDKRRAKYYKLITGNSWDDFTNYDLTVDSSIGIENAVAVILEYIGKLN